MYIYIYNIYISFSWSPKFQIRTVSLKPDPKWGFGRWICQVVILLVVAEGDSSTKGDSSKGIVVQGSSPLPGNCTVPWKICWRQTGIEGEIPVLEWVGTRQKSGKEKVKNIQKMILEMNIPIRILLAWCTSVQILHSFTMNPCTIWLRPLSVNLQPCGNVRIARQTIEIKTSNNYLRPLQLENGIIFFICKLALLWFFTFSFQTCGKKEGLIATRWARSMVLQSPSSMGAAAPLAAGVDRPTSFCWLSPQDLCRLAAGFVAWVEHVL